MSREEERLHKLENAPIPRLLFTYALPSVIGAVVNAFYNIVDRIFIGQGAGDDALAGMAITLPIILFLVAFGMLVGSGAAVRVSIYLGRNDQKTAERLLSNAIMLTFLFNVTICSMVLLFMDPLLHLFGANDIIIPYAKEYLYIVVPANIISDLCFSYNAIMRASGYPHKAMISMLLGAVLNCILDPIFIFGFGWGIKGAAWATVISEIVAAVFVMNHFFSQRHTLHFSRSWSDYRPDFKMMLAIVSIGIAPFVMMIVNSLINIIMNRSFVYYATSTSEANISIAAYGIILSIAQLFIQFMVGVSMGMQPIVGFNFGAKKYERVQETLRLVIITATIIMGVGCFCSVAFPKLITRAFTNDPDLLDVTANGLRISLLVFVVVGSQISISQFFQSIGIAWKAMFLSLSRQVLFLIPAMLLFSRFWGLDGVWYAAPFSDFVAAVTAWLFLWYHVKNMKSKNSD